MIAVKSLKTIPGLKFLTRHIRLLTRPAPLNEFATYDQYWLTRRDDGLTHAHRDRFETIAQRIHDGQRVLDIGCGDGAFLQYLREVRPSCESLGIDTSMIAIEQTRAAGLTARHAPLDKTLPEIAPGPWDVITLMEVIEHVAEAEALIREVLALSPGRLFLSLPNVGCLEHRLRLMVGGRFPVTSIYYHMKEHVRFWTVTDFREWTAMLGLRIHGIYAQFDRKDSIARSIVRRWPALFADRLIYELTPAEEIDSRSQSA